MIDKLKPYFENESIQEDLEDDELALIDGDEEATDPQVDASEILELMPWITCLHHKEATEEKEGRSNQG